MKPAKIISVLAPMLVLLAGCAGSVQGPSPQAPRKVAKVEEPVFVLPAEDMGPPGSMDYSWQPTEAPPPPVVKPRKLDAKPSFVVPTAQKRKLFVLPTKFTPGG